MDFYDFAQKCGNKCVKNFLDQTKKWTTNLFNTPSKIVIQKAVEEQVILLALEKYF